LNFRFGINARIIITGDVNNNPVKLAIESWLDLISTAMMFFAAIIPGYLSLKLRGDISKVTIMLTAFIVVHGIYHVVRMQGAESIADNVFEPASIIVLIAFGVTYLDVSEEILFSSSFGNPTLILLVVALGIFVWLTARSRNIKSFQFQISMFILIWITGEIVDLLGEEGVVELFSTSEIGMYVHVLAMAMFSAMLWIRFYLSEKSGKKIADTLQEG
jgi:hypothetical protein